MSQSSRNLQVCHTNKSHVSSVGTSYFTQWDNCSSTHVQISHKQEHCMFSECKEQVRRHLLMYFCYMLAVLPWKCPTILAIPPFGTTSQNPCGMSYLGNLLSPLNNALFKLKVLDVDTSLSHRFCMFEKHQILLSNRACYRCESQQVYHTKILSSYKCWYPVWHELCFHPCSKTSGLMCITSEPL